MSNFSFSHSVFYPFWELSIILIKFEIVSATSLSLDRFEILSFGNGRFQWYQTFGSDIKNIQIHYYQLFLHLPLCLIKQSASRLKKTKKTGCYNKWRVTYLLHNLIFELPKWRNFSNKVENTSISIFSFFPHCFLSYERQILYFEYCLICCLFHAFNLEQFESLSFVVDQTMFIIPYQVANGYCFIIIQYSSFLLYVKDSPSISISVFPISSSAHILLMFKKTLREKMLVTIIVSYSHYII